MSIPLLTTKLYIPPQRPNLVPRSRLLARLDQALRSRHHMILISAKAGSGKTTLVSEWVHQQQRPTAWLSLDANDNDPRRFCSYLIAALRRLDIHIGQTVLSQLEMPDLPHSEDLVAELINDVTARAILSLLVLDDYHVIQHEWIHRAVGFLAEHQPPEMHLVLITRVDPPLPLTRLRGRGQMTEIRDRDLRFTAEEADWFVSQVMGLDLPAEALSTLERRTEGWIVGLQMAAISMQGRKQDGDLAAFVEAFGGTNRYILDYLMDEVLNRQPPAIQGFLIESSILARMCGSLCDAMRSGGAELPGEMTEISPSGVTGAEARPGGGRMRDGQAILVHLEQSNLFVLPLDDERRWYRYHHLFADLLRRTLEQRRSETEIRELHRRASRWHQCEGSLEEAMRHAMAAQDFEQAALLIEENIVSMLSRSEAPVLLDWIGQLPEQTVRSHPWIDVYRANTLALSGRPEEAESLLDGVEQRIEADTPRVSELLGHIAAIRAYAADLRGDAPQVFEMAALAEKRLPKEHLVARGMSTYALTVTYFAADDMERSIKAALRMLEIGQELDRLLMILTGLCDLAAASKVQGRLRRAEEYYARARTWMVERNGLDSRVRTAYEVGLADLMFQRNQLDAAQEHAMTGIEYSRRFEAPSELVSGYVALMRASQARGDAVRALSALRDAEQAMQTHRVRLSVKTELRTARVAQWLAVGDVEAASRWAKECDGGSELEQMALGRLRLAQGRAADAHRLLERQRALAEAGGRTGRLIEILGLQALALDAQGQADEAEAALSMALSLARPEDHVRVFLDLGWPLRELLGRSMTRGAATGAQGAEMARIAGAYGRSLLDAFQQERETQASRAVDAISPPPILAEAGIDPLTERELEVLRLLTEGLSNKRIADRLVVAPSTVKQHLKSIYGKLDVHSRTQAVARGRELGLL